ncbi:fasciclin domain-containing protein [Pontibacter ummariensis]|nr:fasciclin domain-containing protein [Pontibacter ummariensis]
MIATAAMLFGCAGTDENVYSETERMGGVVVRQEAQTELADFEAKDDAETYVSIYDNMENTEQYDVLTLIKMNPNLSTFAQLLDQANVEADLLIVEPTTILAPTNEAFENMDREQFDYLMDPQNRVALMKVVKAHILPSEVEKYQFNTTQRLETTEGEYVDVNVNPDLDIVSVGGATIVWPNVKASNGLIHVVDDVIVPESAQVWDDE